MVLVKYLQAEPGKGGGGLVTIRKAEVRSQLCFQSSPLFDEQLCARVDSTCIRIYLALLTFTLWKNNLLTHGRAQVGRSRSHLLAQLPSPPPFPSCYDNSNQLGNIWRRRVTHSDHKRALAQNGLFCGVITTSRCLLHLPPLLHPFVLGDVPGEHLPPPLLQHIGEGQRGHNGERLFQQEVDLGFWKQRLPS